LRNEHDDVIVCRCEEVTIGEILKAIKEGAATVNEIKRWTRAGMGLCQGRTCKVNVAKILARETHKNPKDVLPSTYRQPVRPVKMGVLSDNEKANECKKRRALNDRMGKIDHGNGYTL